MKSKILFVALLCLAGLNLLAQSEDELKRKVEKINKEMAKNMLEGNYTAGYNNYTADAISLPNNSTMLNGLDAIKASGQSMAQSGIKFKSFETTTMQVKSCGNQVTEIGTFKMSMSIPGMPNDYEDHGKYLTIWEKQADGSLKIKVEMWNTDVNPMGGAM